MDFHFNLIKFVFNFCWAFWGGLCFFAYPLNIWSYLWKNTCPELFGLFETLLFILGENAQKRVDARIVINFKIK